MEKLNDDPVPVPASVKPMENSGCGMTLQSCLGGGSEGVRPLDLKCRMSQEGGQTLNSGFLHLRQSLQSELTREGLLKILPPGLGIRLHS